MNRIPPSIFNDVIGPVMRGPSSSHTAASVRIAKMAASMLGQPVRRALFEFDPGGSLATTYDGQGTALGLAAGFLGLDMKDERMKDALRIAKEQGVHLDFVVTEYENDHPNTYKMTLWGPDGKGLHLTALSTGGGMIEFTRFDGYAISSRGDYHEAFVFAANPGREDRRALAGRLESEPSLDVFEIQVKGQDMMLNLKSSSGPCHPLVESLGSFLTIGRVYFSEPVLPVLSRKEISVPFLNAAEALAFQPTGWKEPWEAAAWYESQRSGKDVQEVVGMMQEIVSVMEASIQAGLKGTAYKDRLLGQQSHLMGIAMEQDRLIPAGLMNKVVAATMAMMEVKSSLGLIVAAPTAGSCATLPGVLLTTGKELGLDPVGISKGMLVAGLVGVFIAEKSTFAAELAGCQAECGAATGMAAAGLVQLAGGTLKQSFDAASMALQNIFGLACDPVANRVEVPCLGKNIMAAVNALTAANMALAGVDAVLPLDEVISAMDRTGRSLPFEIRCTGYGGLSITPTAKKLEEGLRQKE